MQKSPALKLLSELRADLADPDFVWQLLTLLACLGTAFVLARAWRQRRTSGEPAGKLQEAGTRLAFPVLAVVLIGSAKLALAPIMHVNLLRVALPLMGSMALVRGVVFVLRQAFPRAAWLAAWERIIAALVWGWLALYITDLAPYVIDALEQVDFTLGKQTINLWMILHGVVTIFLTVVVALWVAGLLEARLMRLEEIDSSLRIVGVRVAKALLTVIALLTSLSMVGIDMTALSVFTGALGVGLGFGLQKIASNYVSGFIILLDRSIRLGNVVQVGNDAGMVTQITTRYTVLRHPTGSEAIVPNEILVSSVVQNQTLSDTRVRLATQVGVAYDSDLERAMALMVEVAKAQPRILTEPEPRVTMLQFADSSIVLELGFWIEDPDAGKGNLVSDVNLGIWRAFRANGITIPFPQREIRVITSELASA